MISGNNFPNMNCIAVIGYKLQNGDMFFSFLFVSFFLLLFILFLFICLSFCSFFLFFSFFLFYSFFIFFSWVSRQWDNLHLVFKLRKMFLEVIFFLSFFFCAFFGEKM